MTSVPPPTTRPIVRGYYDAWSRGDIATVHQYFADQVDFTGALRHGKTAAEYLDALATFSKLITGENRLISELYGEHEATLIYEAQTVAGPIRIAEHLRLIDDKITGVLLILDPAPLVAFRASKAEQQNA